MREQASFNPTDTQLLESALWHAARDLGRPPESRQVVARGSTRPRGEDEGKGRKATATNEGRRLCK